MGKIHHSGQNGPFYIRGSSRSRLTAFRLAPGAGGLGFRFGGISWPSGSWEFNRPGRFLEVNR